MNENKLWLLYARECVLWYYKCNITILTASQCLACGWSENTQFGFLDDRQSYTAQSKWRVVQFDPKLKIDFCYQTTTKFNKT